MSDEVARWQSKGGKYVVSLFQDDTGFFYRGDGCGGYLGRMDTPDAIAAIERRLPDLQSDTNKTPMRRVYPNAKGETMTTLLRCIACGWIGYIAGYGSTCQRCKRSVR